MIIKIAVVVCLGLSLWLSFVVLRLRRQLEAERQAKENLAAVIRIIDAQLKLLNEMIADEIVSAEAEFKSYH